MIALGKNNFELHCVNFKKKEGVTLEELCKELFFEPSAYDVFALPIDGYVHDVQKAHSPEELMNLHQKIGLRSAHAVARDSLHFSSGSW